jgi:anti-sigma B factor antagonist
MGSVVLDTSEPGVAIVSLEGEHELYSATKLQRRLHELIGQDAGIVVDLSSATFLDSSIVSVLLQIRDEARAAGVPFSIVIDDATGESVRRMFKVTGLSAILPIVDSRAAALSRAN